MTIRAFSLLYLGLRLAVINECEDEISVLQLCRRTFHLTGAARLLLVDQSPGVARPPHEVEQHRQVGEGGRQQRPGVEELDGKVESRVPEAQHTSINNKPSPDHSSNSCSKLTADSAATVGCEGVR